MKNSAKLITALALLLVYRPVPAEAQLHLATLTEMQRGNLPGKSPGGLRTLYHQLNMDYAGDGLRLGLRGEGFTASRSDRGYGHLAQRFVHYRRGRLQLEAGHFYAILGSGLLLHAYELPGVITEGRGSRRRYQLTRDLDGFHLRYRRPQVDLRLFHGTPVASDLPPGLEGVDRREGSIQGGGLLLHPFDLADVGLGAMHAERGGEEELDITTHIRLRLVPLLERLGLEEIYAELYGEYAQRDAALDRWFSLNRELPRALYLAATATWAVWGMSLEYKDYRDFLIIDVNNPPPLIREHDVFLLNRITHDLLPDDETGMQLELTRSFARGQTLVANLTDATRRQLPGREDDEELRELFLQVDSPLGESLYGRFFADLNQNQIPRKDERYLTFGSGLDWQIGTAYALNADLQFQDVDRRFGDQEFPFTNLYLNLGMNRVAGGSLSLLLQRSTDSLETGASPSGATFWWGISAGWEMRHGHRLDLFAGKRRSGLACSAGTCYEVLGFEGVAIRLFDQWF